MSDPKNDAQFRLEAFQESIPEKSMWQHHKGGRYEVITTCVKEDTLEPMVIYRSLRYGSIWARTIENWVDTVDTNGVSVPRFIRLAE